MLDDINEQPDIIENLLDYFISSSNNLQNIQINNELYNNLNTIYIVASGSSRNVGSLAKNFLEESIGVPVIVDYASEFAHRNPQLKQNDLIIAISQSGETADTFRAIQLAQNKNAKIIAITNNPESKIHKIADYSLKVNAGKELSVPATKSFTAQFINLFILGLYISEQNKTLSRKQIQQYLGNLKELSGKIKLLIDQKECLNEVVNIIKDLKKISILGRNSNFAAAQEASLKIKETAYIDANGYPTGEFLHGYIASIEENEPIISIMPDISDVSHYKLALNNTEDIKKKRNPFLIIIKSSDNKEILENTILKDSLFINIPPSDKETYSLLVVIVFQLLSYKTAKILNKDMNNPRGLTKALTSE